MKEAFKTARANCGLRCHRELPAGQPPGDRAVCVTWLGRKPGRARPAAVAEARARPMPRRQMAAELGGLAEDLNGRLEDHEQLGYLVAWWASPGLARRLPRALRAAILQRRRAAQGARTTGRRSRARCSGADPGCPGPVPARSGVLCEPVAGQNDGVWCRKCQCRCHWPMITSRGDEPFP